MPTADCPHSGNTTLSVSSIVGGSIPNAVAASAMAVVNSRVGVPAKQIWDIITSQLGDVQYIEISRLSDSSNPLAFDVVKGWLPKKIMPYGTDLGIWTVNNTKFLLGVGSIATAHSE
jgi:acetylornithine deacetylase